ALPLLCLLPLISSARASRHGIRVAKPEYSQALAAANRFLSAWQAQDHETGITMLSDSARQHASRDRLQEFFSPGPQAAFEIRHGWRSKSGAYVFPVVLFGSDFRARPCKVVISKAGADGWAVSKLP
ncbi:MAG TPA: hypothetical protein VFB00_01215, partial [Terriglobales bacterium]|nr:hypothetical protein [Terriglobales bacterium]